MRSRSLYDARHCPFFSRRPTLEWLDNVPRMAMLETIHFRLLTRFLLCHRSKPQGVCELTLLIAVDDRIGDVEHQAESRAEEREEQNENGVQIKVRAKHEVRCLQISSWKKRRVCR